MAFFNFRMYILKRFYPKHFIMTTVKAFTQQIGVSFISVLTLWKVNLMIKIILLVHVISSLGPVSNCAVQPIFR